jgi:hypothetical protein
VTINCNNIILSKPGIQSEQQMYMYVCFEKIPHNHTEKQSMVMNDKDKEWMDWLMVKGKCGWMEVHGYLSSSQELLPHLSSTGDQIIWSSAKHHKFRVLLPQELISNNETYLQTKP